MSERFVHAAFHSAWDFLHQLVRRFLIPIDGTAGGLTCVVSLALKVFRISSLHSYPRKSMEIP